MGVKGLWRLINCSGTPVPLESLENKILAVDVSIWLHQAVRGFKGAGVANAHLLTLFHRICKLLFYRIKPVFVFDGGVPQLKRQTLSARRLRRELAAGKAQKVRERLLVNLLKSQAIRSALGKKGQGPVINYVANPVKREKDLYELPPLPKENQLIVCDKKDSDKDENVFKNIIAPNLHNFEFENSGFKSLALETQHEILSELQDTRKESSWNMINNMPQESCDFASFQMKRLLKRRKFQETLDGIRSDIRQKHAAEIESQLFGELETHVSLTHRIISEDETHSILIKNIKSDQDNIKIGQLKDQIQNSQKKVSNTKLVGKQDFLTELSKHGIVTITNQNNLLIDSSETEEDSSSDDESYCPLRKKRKLDEIAFLKAMDYVLEENELTQEELLTLIQQSKDEDNAIPIKKDVSSEYKYSDLNKPSTSANASGFIGDKSESDSSVDDEDFIDVTLTDDSITLPSSEIVCNQTVQECVTSPTKGSNIDNIRNAQTNSLYLKIMQQKLDDIVVKASSKNKSTVNDTRMQSQYIVSEDKNIALEKSFKGCDSNNPVSGVAITLEISNKAPISKCDDLFADIFCDSIDKKLNSPLKGKSNCEEILNKIEYRSPLENVGASETFNKYSNCNVIPSKPELIEKQTDSSTVISKEPPTLFTNQLKEKISELLEIEVKKIISCGRGTPVVQEDDLLKTKKIDVITEINPSSINPEKCFNMLSSESSRHPQNESSEQLKSINETKQEVLSISGTIKETWQAKTSKPDSKYTETSNLDDVTKFVSSSVSVDSETGFEKQNTSSLKNVDNINFLTPGSSNCNSVMKPVTYSEIELEEMENHLEKEKNSLIAEASSQDRVATELNDQVYGDAQELIRLFGLPYLVAPMEAEAQCAFLDQIGLVQGTITDDSDIFLFGGQKVYKNFFNQSKQVEFFKLDNIKHNFGLDREKLITLALLTGSDYTIGIESVGTVLGMEILAEFPGSGIDCLKNFKKWWKSAHNNLNIIYTSKTKQRLNSLYLPESFPSENIIRAYLKPDVDDSREKFSWVMPNVKNLVNFTCEKFGWNKSKSSEILIPVLQKLGLKETQLRIDSYFNNIKLVKGDLNSSKRLTEAIKKYKGEVPNNESDADKKNSILSKYKAGNDKLKKSKNKRTLLLVETDGNSFPTTSKSEFSVKKKKSNKNINLSKSSSIADVSSVSKKEERKKLIYEKLLEKEKVPQIETDKIKMSEKKKVAARIFQAQKR